MNWKRWQGSGYGIVLSLLSQHLYGGTEEEYEKDQSGESVCWLRLKLGTSQAQGRSVTISANFHHVSGQVSVVLARAGIFIIF